MYSLKHIYADMHNHTTASDGDLTPEELVQKMKLLEIAVVGITDHDTDIGLERAISEGDKIGINVLPGVEISICFKESFFAGTLHVLCYFNPKLLKTSFFREHLYNTLKDGRGDNLVKARINEINKFFGPANKKTSILKREFTFDEVASYSPTITRRHFALALTQKHGITDSNIVNKIIGNDSPAYLPSGIDLKSLKKFVYFINDNFREKLLNNSNGKLKEQLPLIMTLAHPAAGSFPGKGHYKEVLPPIEIVEKLLPRFIDAGIKAIEINYPGHTEEHRAVLKQWALKYDLLVTGGSDCHDELTRPPGIEGITKEEYKHFIQNI